MTHSRPEAPPILINTTVLHPTAVLSQSTLSTNLTPGDVADRYPHMQRHTAVMSRKEDPHSLRANHAQERTESNAVFKAVEYSLTPQKGHPLSSVGFTRETTAQTGAPWRTLLSGPGVRRQGQFLQGSPHRLGGISPGSASLKCQ